MDASDKKVLSDFKPKHTHFVGVDSDGCAFDSMEIKQKECFIPTSCKHWGFQAISKYARETAEFVNLYSKWRGANRFPAMIKVFDLLAEREEVKRRGVQLSDVASLRKWVDSGAALSNGTLKQAIAKTSDAVLMQALAWSEAINAAIEALVKGVPPFPFVRESLEKLGRCADVICVSATPREALEREWEEAGIARHVAVLAGQELGSKKEHLELATSGRYKKGRVLMVGDALGDLAAARGAGAMFYPIMPGQEEQSWERFSKEIIDLFLADKYTAPVEAGFVKEFENHLPDTPPWKATP